MNEDEEEEDDDDDDLEMKQAVEEAERRVEANRFLSKADESEVALILCFLLHSEYILL